MDGRDPLSPTSLVSVAVDTPPPTPQPQPPPTRAGLRTPLNHSTVPTLDWRVLSPRARTAQLTATAYWDGLSTQSPTKVALTARPRGLSPLSRTSTAKRLEPLCEVEMAPFPPTEEDDLPPPPTLSKPPSAKQFVANLVATTATYSLDMQAIIPPTFPPRKGNRHLQPIDYRPSTSPEPPTSPTLQPSWVLQSSSVSKPPTPRVLGATSGKAGNMDLSESGGIRGACGELSAASLAFKLRGALDENQSRVLDLFREWDADHNGTISKKEFRQALPLLGLKCTSEEADSLFNDLDNDGSGLIEYHELHKQLRQRLDENRPMPKSVHLSSRQQLKRDTSSRASLASRVSGRSYRSTTSITSYGSMLSFEDDIRAQKLSARLERERKVLELSLMRQRCRLAVVKRRNAPITMGAPRNGRLDPDTPPVENQPVLAPTPLRKRKEGLRDDNADDWRYMGDRAKAILERLNTGNLGMVMMA